MPDAEAHVDALDFAIFRYMSPNGEARFWGSRRMIDPRITPREISEKVGVSENGVRARMRSLAAAGFFRGTEVCLNPSLFGVTLSVVEIPIRDSAESKKVLDDLALVDGVTFARDILDEKDRKVRVHFVLDAPAPSQRRLGLLRRLSPQGSVREATPYWVPPCDAPMSPLDWRVLRALRTEPDRTLSRTAESVGITLKTTARRFRRLLDARACWWTHSGPSGEFPLALISILVGRPEDRPGVSAAATEAARLWMPVSEDGMGIEPSSTSVRVTGLVLVETPSSLERLVERIGTIPGVVRVERTFALGSRSYPEWFDRRLEERTHSV